MKKSSFLMQVFRGMIYTLPAVLYFSYYPIISFGTNETMNFELSLPLLWLVFFDVLVVIMVIRRWGLLMDLLRRRWFLWALLFPVFVTFSVLWSLNLVRGLLTVVVMWLLVIAVVGIYILKDVLKDEVFRKFFWRWFFGSALFICAWCVVQCILDVAGVSRECSLLCVGCTSYSFGFPHPNGFAIEPQFMGNLLLAPSIISGWLLLKKQNNRKLEQKHPRGDNFYNESVGARTKLQFRGSLRDCRENYSGSRLNSSNCLLLCFFIFTATLFLTFSRGAIYAFIVAMIFMTTFFVVKTKKWKVIVLWPVIALAFVFTLNLQGILAQVSPTNDTYSSGVAKVLHHLSLGMIDVRAKDEEKPSSTEGGGGIAIADEDEAVFDGYVAESTEVRKMLTRNAIAVWLRDFRTVLFGVGIGGAGQAMYDAGLIDSPKEIVQNEYVSLLLEIGLVGVVFLVFGLVIVVKMAVKNAMMPAVLTLLVAYGVTIVFFSGFANALQIYLLPCVFLML